VPREHAARDELGEEHGGYVERRRRGGDDERHGVDASLQHDVDAELVAGEERRLGQLDERYFADNEVEDIARKIVLEAGKLYSGFDAINDICACKPVSNEVGVLLKETQSLLRKAGMRRVVRVVGPEMVTGEQFAQGSRELGYTAVTARTVAEAEKLLDR